MQEHIDNVEKFMNLASQEVPSIPTVPSTSTREFRAEIILEEALETIEALGVTVQINGTQVNTSTEFEFRADKLVDLVEVLDGCVDMLWVGPTGTALACGMKNCILPAIKEVDRSNLSKFIDGYKSPSGKWIKGPSYSPANLEVIVYNAHNTD